MILSNKFKQISSQNKILSSLKSNVKTLQELSNSLRSLKLKRASVISIKASKNKANIKSKKGEQNTQKILNKSLINYIVNVNLSPTNTLVNVTDVAGNPKASFSGGLVNLTKKQKKKQPGALINIFRILLSKARFLKNKPIALHFRNAKKFHVFFLLKALKNKLFIKSVRILDFLPHNGCRPKKIRRIKRRTKRLVLR
jgi:ribosomal protein S11